MTASTVLRHWHTLLLAAAFAVGAACGGHGSIGQSCTFAGHPGTVVASQSQCAYDDAFCDPRGDGTYCTGALPVVCLPGQVREGWGPCMYPDGGQGGASATGGRGGATAEGGAGGHAGGAGGHSVIGQSCSWGTYSGTIVESSSRCYLDDAFCEARGDGTYCTGARPFVCPPDQVRTGWTSCAPVGGAGGGTSTAGGAGGGGAGGSGSAGAGGAGGAGGA